MEPGRGCWSLPATRRPSAPRSGRGSATPSSAGACGGPPGSGARRCAGGRPPLPTSPAFSLERCDECGGRRGQSRVAPPARARRRGGSRSEEHTSELQSHSDLVCRLLLEKKKTNNGRPIINKSIHKNVHT